MPCYNRAHDLIYTLQAYDQQESAGAFELIAVDDASSDSTYELLSSYQPCCYRLRVERMESNQGQGTARNLVIPSVASPLMLFVGDDMIPRKDFIRGHLIAHHRNPSVKAAILGKVEWSPRVPQNTLMSHIDGIGAQQFSYHYLRDGHTYDFRHFYTCNISLKTSFLQSLNQWFDKDFYLYGFEDTELGYRLAKQGMRIIYKSSLVVQHNHYHNFWTFTNRQRNSGRMANVLLTKHPRLRVSPLFRFHYLRVLNLFLSPNIIRKPSQGTVNWIETIACRLGSYHEWNTNDHLDRFYLAVLDYFYYDGFIRELFGDSPLGQRMREAHAVRYLAPTLRWFLQESSSVDRAWSFDNLPGIINRLSQIAV